MRELFLHAFFLSGKKHHSQTPPGRFPLGTKPATGHMVSLTAKGAEEESFSLLLLESGRCAREEGVGKEFREGMQAGSALTNFMTLGRPLYFL